jgi:SAM-dependent methyltransferase
MEELAHRSKNTIPNRYPAVFAAMKKALCWDGQAKKILSIGCGKGDEVHTMHTLFPGSTVHGYDLDKDAIKEAQQANEKYPEVDYFSRKQDLWDDYDLVLCLSVACRYPHSKQFTFAQFCRLMRDIDSCIAPGGFLAIYNAQYNFELCDIADDYIPIDVGRHDSGTVPKFTPSGEPLGPEFWVPILFKKCTLCSTVPQLLPFAPSAEQYNAPPTPWKPWSFEDLGKIHREDEAPNEVQKEGEKEEKDDKEPPQLPVIPFGQLLLELPVPSAEESPQPDNGTEAAPQKGKKKKAPKKRQ